MISPESSESWNQGRHLSTAWDASHSHLLLLKREQKLASRGVQVMPSIMVRLSGHRARKEADWI